MNEKIQELVEIVNNMEDTTLRLEKAYKVENQEDFEEARKIIIEFQNKLSKKLKVKR